MTTAHEDQFTPAPVEVTQADREAAAKHLGYSDPYSELLATEQAEIDELAAILAHFSRHRIAHSAPAGEVEPVAWMYSNGDDLTPCVSLNRWKDIVDGKWVDGSPDWTETPLYAAPPADLVEVLRNCLAAGLPEEVASAVRAALAKHGGA